MSYTNLKKEISAIVCFVVILQIFFNVCMKTFFSKIKAHKIKPLDTRQEILSI